MRSVVLAFLVAAGLSGFLFAEETPQRVSIQIVGATIAPSRVDGSKWLGFGKAKAAQVSKVMDALLMAEPHVAVINALAQVAMSTSDKPIPYGVVDVATAGKFHTNARKGFGDSRQHSFTPFFGNINYQDIPLDYGTRIEVRMWNYHPIEKRNIDPIGVAEINSDDLKKALDSQKIYQLNVSDQTQNQLLFIAIEVRAQE